MGDTDLTVGRVRLTVTKPDGKPVPWGRVEVVVRDGHAVASRRRSSLVEADVVSVEHQGKRNYVLTMTDGATWTTQGCGCGG